MASTYIKRDLSVSETIYKFTWSAWVKRSQITAHNTLFKSRTDGNNWCQSYFESDDTLFLQSYKNGGYHYNFRTNRLFRDTNAWYHIVLNVDSSQSTAGDRVRIYVNGERETSFQTSTNNLSNGDSLIFNTSDSGTGHTIGSWNTSNYLDGVLSHVHYSSGYSYAPTVFGSTDSTTGEWKINTSPSFTLGGNGYTVLKDGNTITDQSSNSNDFTLGGGTLTKTEDCPDNVFATINPLDKDLTGTLGTYLYGNNRFSSSGNSSSNNGTRCTLGASSGKYYWEVKNVQNALVIGIQDADASTRFTSTWTWGIAGTYAVKHNGEKSINGTDTSSAVPTYTNGDILMLAMDLDNQKLYFGKNGTWANSGDPTSGSTGTGSLGNLVAGTTYIPVVSNSSWNQNTIADFNFGNGYFGTTAVSSAGTNASGNGIFEYNVPTGYTALSTKGLNL